MIRHFKWSVVFWFSFLGCSDDTSSSSSPTDPGPQPDPPKIAQLVLSQSEYTFVSLGSSAQLRITASDQYGTYMPNPQITWTTSDTLKVTVNQRGLITAISQGSAVVTAQSGTIKASVAITVDQEVKSIDFETELLRFESILDTISVEPIVKDARGQLVTPVIASWSSADETIVSISQEGLVTSQGNGRTQITVTSEAISESLTVIVNTDGLIIIASITPAILTEGLQGTIMGAGLWGTSGNELTIGGYPAQVTTATPYQIDFVLPSFNCLPPRKTQLTLKNDSDSAATEVSVSPQNLQSLNPGESIIATDGCLQLAKGDPGGKYLIGALNITEDPGSLIDVAIEVKPGLDTNLELFASRTAGPNPFARTPFASLIGTAPNKLTVPSEPTSNPLMNLNVGRHNHGEQLIRDNERLLIEEIGVDRIRQEINNSKQTFHLQRGFYGEPILGDTIPFNMGLSCASGDTLQIQAKLAYVGNETLWYEDLANPLEDSFSQAEYTNFDTKYSENTLPALQDYFGNYGDIDSNGKLSVLVTKEVNKRKNVLGFVWGGDLVPDNLCPGANQAELFYGLAPDPDGLIEGVVPKSWLTEIYDPLIAHETTHVIQITRAFYENAKYKSTWEMEGGATLAEQIVGFRIYGHDSGMNLGLSEYNAGFKWYKDWAGDLTRYFGDSGSGKVNGAPEQCSWLGKESQNNKGPCINRRAVYGVPSIFIRMILDVFGPTYPGGEKALSRDLVGATDYGGFANFEERTGDVRGDLLAKFAMTLWGDGRVSDNLTSWNIHDVMQRWTEDGRLQPYENILAEESLNVSVRGGSNAYLEWSPPSQHAPSSVHIRDPLGSLTPNNMLLWIQRIE